MRTGWIKTVQSGNTVVGIQDERWKAVKTNLWSKKTNFGRLPHKTHIENRNPPFDTLSRGAVFFSSRCGESRGKPHQHNAGWLAALSPGGDPRCTRSRLIIYQSPLPSLQRALHCQRDIVSLELQLWLSLCVRLTCREGGGDGSSPDEAVGSGWCVIRNLLQIWHWLLLF